VLRRCCDGGTYLIVTWMVEGMWIIHGWIERIFPCRRRRRAVVVVSSWTLLHFFKTKTMEDSRNTAAHHFSLTLDVYISERMDLYSRG
jgi:hypothetical protein